MPEYWFVSAPGEGNRTVTFQNFKAKIASSQNDFSEVAPLPIPEFKVQGVACMRAFAQQLPGTSIVGARRFFPTCVWFSCIVSKSL